MRSAGIRKARRAIASLLMLQHVLALRPLEGASPQHLCPHVRFQTVGLADVKWERGFWADKFTLCRTSVLPAMGEVLLDEKNAATLINFRIGAGLQKGTHHGTNWGDGDCYKYLEALARVYAVTPSEELDREMDLWIDLIGKTQAPDGYISTQTQLNCRKKRWGARAYHELYNMGHLMTAASVHYRATGKRNFLKIACKTADYLVRVFSPRPKHLAHFGWNPSHIMGLCDLHHATGDSRYLALAGTFVDMRGSFRWRPGGYTEYGVRDPHPGDQTQNRVPLRKESQAVGHAVTATYLYCGAADVSAHTGEDALTKALERIWHDVVSRKMYVTGAVGAYHRGVSPRGDKVHEAFGAAYDLPNRTAYNETCANIGNAMWNWRMLTLTGRACFGDVMECALYNSVLSGMSLDGKRFFYTNVLERHTGAPLLNNDTQRRWRLHSCYCCPPNVARTLAKVAQWAYGVTKSEVWVHLFGSSRLATTLPEGGTVQLKQRSSYPWSGTVTITVEKAPPQWRALLLRIPAWCTTCQVHVNGRPADRPPTPGSYLRIERHWRPGDTVVLTLPLQPVLLTAHPLVEQCHNKVAVRYGPLIYCLEGVDLPPSVRVRDVRLPRRPRWHIRHDPNVLGGVTLLSCEATAYRSKERRALYRELRPENPRRITATFIPYCTWNNRHACDMAVWIPSE